MCSFRLRFHWSLFPRVKLTIFQHWFRWWLGADQATSHYLNQRWKIYRRIYASLGLNGSTRASRNTRIGTYDSMFIWYFRARKLLILVNRISGYCCLSVFDFIRLKWTFLCNHYISCKCFRHDHSWFRWSDETLKCFLFAVRQSTLMKKGHAQFKTTTTAPNASQKYLHVYGKRQSFKHKYQCRKKNIIISMDLQAAYIWCINHMRRCWGMGSLNLILVGIKWITYSQDYFFRSDYSLP